MFTPLELPSLDPNQPCVRCARDAKENGRQKQSFVEKNVAKQ